MSPVSSTLETVKARAFQFPLSDPLTTARATYPSLAGVLVRVGTKDGVFGYGEARKCFDLTGETQTSIIAAINDHLGPAIRGCEPLDTSGLHRAMNGAIAANTAAKSALDIAVHDIAGKLAGVPVSMLLGGAPRGPMASSKAVSVGPLEAMVAQARSYVRAGFMTLKIKTGVDAEVELAAIAAIRSQLGPKVTLKLDANQGWTLAQATRFLETVQVHDITMVEQPLAAADLKGSALLRQRTPIPVMLDESVHSANDALKAIELEAADFINIKLLKTGGLRPALDLTAICAAAGIGCQIGTLDTSIGSAAAVHLAHACDIIQFAEINGPSRLRQDVGSGFVLHDGSANIDASPGLGVIINPEIRAVFDEKEATP
jgi:L-alanine-DL-glutamate epimerase-like enolase superfamily enzyme